MRWKTGGKLLQQSPDTARFLLVQVLEGHVLAEVCEWHTSCAI